MPFQDAIKNLKPYDARGNLTVFIETPKGSRQKYDVDHESGLFTWALELPEGVTFPYSFGFVPNTLAEDGDPLDILLLLDGEVPPGTLVPARAIGVLELEQDEGDAGMVRNDRVVAVATLSRVFARVEKIEDLRDGLLWELEEFFSTYNRMIDRKVNFLGTTSVDRAHTLVQEAIRNASEGSG